jgi:seryl-tRNA synthetase
MDYFDRRVKQIAMGLPNAQEYRYPTLLPTHVLDEFGYFASFPQFMMFVTRLHNDLDVYRAFVQEYESNQRITPALFSHCQNHDYCLPPTMCYHTYHQYRGQQLDKNMVVTAKGKSFRFESKYYRGLERLWDFTIREIVFMGTREFVLECRQAFMQQAFALMEELDLHGYCEVANDPFFVAGDTASKIFSQRALELKYELRLHVAEKPTDRSIAVASFNFHEKFFGETFHISQENQNSILTGCVGFGLERLVYAFLCQHGLDAAKWPQIVKRELGK